MPDFPDAEIIAVGSELLTPARIDTNSLYLTGKLNDLGIEVVRKSAVGDHRERLAAAFRAALASAEVVIVTGGLGPTEDDVTRDAAASALGRTLVFRQDIADWLAARFAKLGRKMAEINLRQAYVVDGSEVLPNPNGTAPGLWIEEGARVLMLLPGPPRELKPMFEQECLPRLQARCPEQVIRTLTFRVAGMGESDLDALIAPIYTKYTNPVTTVLAAAGDVQVHLRARCETAVEADALLADVGPPIEERLGDRIYSRNGDPLEVVIGKLLTARRETLAVAESCTGGLLAERITRVPGSSEYFTGGFVTYTSRMKIEALRVDPKLIAEYTAVSEPTARAMAEGARNRAGATYALATTGVAGPGGGTDENPVGTVYIAVAGPDGTWVKRFRFPGDRERVRGFAVQTALDMLRRTITRATSPLAWVQDR